MALLEARRELRRVLAAVGEQHELPASLELAEERVAEDLADLLETGSHRPRTGERVRAVLDRLLASGLFHISQSSPHAGQMVG